MKSIPEQCVPYAIRLLQLLVFSRKPLTLIELVDAVVTEPDDATPLDVGNRFTPPELLLECCSGFLRVTHGHTDGMSSYDGSGAESDNDKRYVQLAHFSVQEYLLLDREQNPYGLHFRAIAANAKITQICLSYLWSTMGIWSIQEASIKFPFTKYAALYWFTYADTAGDSEDRTFSWMLKAITDRPFLSYLLAIYQPVEADPHLVQLASIASFSGLTRSIEILLNNGFDPNTCFSHGTSALTASSEFGHVETARILLDHGANVNARDNSGHTALYVAVPNMDMMQLLLDRGAVIPANEKDKYLNHAVYANSLEAVRLLLNTGVGIDATGGRYSMALLTACGWNDSYVDNAGSGKEDLVLQLIQSGADPNGSENGRTALHTAASRGYHQVVKLLLRFGAKLTTRIDNGESALDGAALQGHLQVVELLVTYTMHISVREGHYESALIAAAYNGHLCVVEYLLDVIDHMNIGMNRSRTGSDGDQADILDAACAADRVELVKNLLEDDGAGETSSETKDIALRLIMNPRKPEVIQMLRNHGVAKNLRDCRYSFGTALAAAAYGGHTDIVRLLLRTNLDVDDAQWYRDAGSGELFHNTPLQAASSHGHLETVRVLLEAGAQVNTETGFYGYALHGALAGGHKDVSLLLLESGADIRSIGGICGTALHAAAFGGILEIVKLCLESGMDVNMPNEERGTAICFAACQSSLEIIQFLLDHGANINYDSGQYGTPLEIACEHGRLDVVELLIRNGVNISFKPQPGAGAINNACRRGFHKLMAYLIGQGADINDIDDDVVIKSANGDINILKLLVDRFSASLLKAACLSGRTDSVLLLLEHGIDVKSTEQECGGLLHDACMNDDEGLVVLLFEHQADVNARGEPYGTALQAAAVYSSVPMVEMLLKFGADPNVWGGRYGSALSAASEFGSPEMVRILLEYGADPNVWGGKHGSALSAASKYGSLEMVRILLEYGADPNIWGGEYGSELLVASKFGSPERIRILLEYGADVNTPRLHHDTSFHRNSSFERLDEDSRSPDEMVNPIAQNEWHSSPLSAASHEGNIEIVRLLLTKGAISNSQGRPYWLALLGAVRWCHEDVAALLFQKNTESLQATPQACSTTSRGRSFSVPHVCSTATLFCPQDKPSSIRDDMVRRASLG
ncbi:hypothetical protein E4T39_02258 [Aureobasidium subglaciale]|nr:hypothetical protein E4T39_02258 [Aureobasidium subglaciale]